MILREAVGKIRFDEKLTHGEDTWFMFQILINGADVSVLYRDWYYYRQREKSVGKIYSVDTCRSKYKVEKYLCDSYIRNGRVPDAKRVERALFNEMIIWSEDGRRKNDIQLIRYMGYLIEHEKRSWIFSQLRKWQKIVFCLGYDHYGVYKFIMKIIGYYHRMSDIFWNLINRSIL